MKKLIITAAIVLGLGMTSFADPTGGGIFKRGAVPDEEYNMGKNRDGHAPLLPNHGSSDNQDGNESPVGTGIALFVGFGVAYMLGKNSKKK